jgi:glycogen(starch) synthase
MVSEDLPHQSIGGLGRHLLTLSQSLSLAGHTVDLMGNNLVPFAAIQGESAFLSRFYPDLNLKHIGFKEVNMGIYNPLRYPFVAWRFARAIMRRAGDYDVIHYHGHFPLVANYIPRHVNFIQTRHDQGSDCLTHTRFRNHDVCRETSPYTCAHCATTSPNAVQRYISAGAVSVYRKLVARAFLRHKTIFVSDMLLRNFSRTAGMAEWGSVVHNFVNLKEIEAFSESSRVYTGQNEVLIAGKLMAGKGIQQFLNGIAGHVPQNMRIRIAGDGEMESLLRNKYESDRIILLGWRSHQDVLRLMSTAVIVVVPSILEEAFGLVALEGLMMGKKVFALNRGGTPELLIYQKYQGQLLLFNTLSGLIEEVINYHHIPGENLKTYSQQSADVGFVRDHIVGIYRSGYNAGIKKCH